MKHTLHRFDSRLTKFVAASFGAKTRPLFLAVTRLGDPVPVVIIALAIGTIGYLAGNLGLIAMGVAIPATTTIGYLLKLLFERARPMTEYALNMKLQTFSFPSGHSSGSTIAYGSLVYIWFQQPTFMWHALAVVGCLVPVGVGISRVYLGAHFPSDVIAGWLLGLVMLTLVILGVHPL